MPLESTIICVDNSDYMRNGDFVPTRLQAQQDAVNLVSHSKTRSNPENNVGLLALSNTEVLATLTTDVGRILSKLHQVQPNGNIKFVSGVRIAHLALKHRQSKNHKMRIVCFVGSPIDEDEKELTKLAKRLKKEKVNVDVINFGEETLNTDKLTTFINTINGKDGNTCHLVTVPPGPLLSEALMTSPVVVGEDGTGGPPANMAGFEFGIDPNEDPELALALRVSMEEQRARQEDEARKVAQQSAEEAGVPPKTEETSEEVLLKQALEMSMQAESETPSAGTQSADFNTMSEDEQIAYALRMSMQPDGESEGATPMETDEGTSSKAGKEKKNQCQMMGDDEDESDSDEYYTEDEDYSEVINDPAFLQSVLQGLPGVDPESEAIKNAMGALTSKDEKKDDKNKKKDDKK